MSNLDDRQKAFEAKFGQDQEMRFKAEMRRNRHVGHWAATQLGLEGDEFNSYIQEVVESDFTEPGDKDILEKIKKDFDAHGVDITEHRIRLELDHKLADAYNELMSE